MIWLSKYTDLFSIPLIRLENVSLSFDLPKFRDMLPLLVVAFLPVVASFSLSTLIFVCLHHHTHNLLARRRTLNHSPKLTSLAKWLGVRLLTK